MVDLGRGLRNALAKITGAAIVDERAVKELVKELQRVLISNDVNVKLVFELTKRIEQRALDTRALKGLSTKEHVVKVVYDELAGLMGERHEPKLKKQKILLLGLYGSGKCVHPDTIVPLADGTTKKISEIYDSIGSEEEAGADGFIKKNVSLEVFAFDPSTLRLTPAKGTAIWKLKKTEPLCSVSIDNGSNEGIVTTPEHPFFVLEGGVILQKRADELRLGDFVAMPGLLPIPTEETTFDIPRNLPPSVRLSGSALASDVKRFMKERFGMLTGACGVLSPHRPYCQISAELKRGEVDARLLINAKALGFEVGCPPDAYLLCGGRKNIHFPSKLTPELSEFMGYVYGDGNIDKNSVHITNEDDEVVERLVFLGERLFGLKPAILREKRSSVNLRRISFSSKILTSLITGIFGLPRGKKSRVLSLPQFFMLSDKDSRRAFLRAYFDCDGYVEEGSRHIELATASKVFAYQLRVLLLVEGITSSYSVKHVKGIPYYRVFLRGKETNIFADNIGSSVKKKTNRLLKLAEISEGQTEGKLENLHVGTALREVREYFGASIGDLQEYVSSYGIYERRGVISRCSLAKFLAALDKTKNINNRLLEKCLEPAEKKELQLALEETCGRFNASLWRLQQQSYVSIENGTARTTQAGRLLLLRNEKFDHYKLEFLKLLSDSDIKWGRVNKIELDETSEYVYDLTVDNYHNFVANNFIVHNTTSAGKVAHFFKSRGLSAGLICCDVDRPAAYEQLEQVAKKAGAPFYGVKGEKDVKRIIMDASAKAKEDVLILDSSGRSAFDEKLVQQLKVINEFFRPDEKFLVISADIGQVAGKQAQEFHNAVGLSGVIITKMDGSGKGGGALSAVARTDAKAAFIGIGEKLEDFEIFDAKKFVGRLLGFPDLEALMDKVKKISEEEKLPAAGMEEKFTIKVFYEQLRAARKLGPLGNVFSMLGAPDLPKDMVQQSEEKLKKFEVIINSMSSKEREDATLLRKGKGRIERIAKGSGTSEAEVRELLNQFEKVSSMMNAFKKNRGFRKKLEKMMKGKGVDLSALGGAGAS